MPTAAQLYPPRQQGGRRQQPQMWGGALWSEGPPTAGASAKALRAGRSCGLPAAGGPRSNHAVRTAPKRLPHAVLSMLHPASRCPLPMLPPTPPLRHTPHAPCARPCMTRRPRHAGALTGTRPTTASARGGCRTCGCAPGVGRGCRACMGCGIGRPQHAQVCCAGLGRWRRPAGAKQPGWRAAAEGPLSRAPAAGQCAAVRQGSRRSRPPLPWGEA